MSDDYFEALALFRDKWAYKLRNGAGMTDYMRNVMSFPNAPAYEPERFYDERYRFYMRHYRDMLIRRGKVERETGYRPPPAEVVRFYKGRYQPPFVREWDALMNYETLTQNTIIAAYDFIGYYVIRGDGAKHLIDSSMSGSKPLAGGGRFRAAIGRSFHILLNSKWIGKMSSGSPHVWLQFELGDPGRIQRIEVDSYDLFTLVSDIERNNGVPPEKSRKAQVYWTNIPETKQLALF